MKGKMDYVCLKCNSKQKVSLNADQLAPEVIVCRSCHGAMVDSFRLLKYKSNQKPTERALYVRSQIIQGGIENCRSLTPEQVDIILSLGDAYVKEGENRDNRGDE